MNAAPMMELVSQAQTCIALVRSGCYPEVERKLKNDMGLPPDASREDLLESLKDELAGLMEAEQ